MVFPVFELPQGVAGKKIVPDPPVGDLPDSCLGAVLAEFEEVRLCRFGPSAAHASESVGFVLAHQGRRRTGDNPLAGQALGERPRRTPAARRRIVWLEGPSSSLPRICCALV